MVETAKPVLAAGIASAYTSDVPQLVILHVIAALVATWIIIYLVHHCRRRRNQTFMPRGLDSSALRSLPVTVYRAGDFEEGLECPVCLCELVDGQKARVLPTCGHGVFHLECIDMWIRSCSTCPLCRCAVVPVKPSSDARDPAAEGTEPTPPPPPPPPETPPESQVAADGPHSSTAERSRQNNPGGTSVIGSVQRSESEGGAPLPRRRSAAEEMEPAVSESARWRSVRRCRSMVELMTPASAPCSSSSSTVAMGGDIEQGLGGGGER